MHKAIAAIFALVLSAFGTSDVLSQPVVRTGYSGIGVGADDLLRVIEKERLWQRHGLDVRAVYFSNGSLLAQAILGGDVQVSDSDVPSMLNIGVSGMLDVKVIGITINRLEHSFVVRNSIRTTTELKGKRIAISRFGSASDITTRLVVRFWKLDPDKDVIILQSGNTPSRIASLVSGHIDAALINPSQVYAVLGTGCCRVLADLADLPMDYARFGTAVSTRLLKTQRPMLRRYMEAVIDGIHAYKTHPEVVFEVYKKAGIKDPEAAKQTYEKVIKSLREDPTPDPKGVQAVLDSLPNSKARGARAADFIDESLVEEIKATGFIDRLYGRK